MKEERYMIFPGTPEAFYQDVIAKATSSAFIEYKMISIKGRSVYGAGAKFEDYLKLQQIRLLNDLDQRSFIGEKWIRNGCPLNIITSDFSEIDWYYRTICKTYKIKEAEMKGDLFRFLTTYTVFKEINDSFIKGGESKEKRTFKDLFYHKSEAAKKVVGILESYGFVNRDKSWKGKYNSLQELAAAYHVLQNPQFGISAINETNFKEDIKVFYKQFNLTVAEGKGPSVDTVRNNLVWRKFSNPYPNSKKSLMIEEFKNIFLPLRG